MTCMSDPATKPLIASVPPKLPTCVWLETSAAADGALPSMRLRSTSRPRFSKRPSSFAMNGARFAGVTLPYDDLILIGVGVAVGAEAATVGAELAAGVLPPHATATSSAVMPRARTRPARIHTSRDSRPRGRPERSIVIPFGRAIGRSPGGERVGGEGGRVFLRGITSEQYG